MDSDEFNKISFALEDHHLLFYKMWALGKPFFNPDIQTAQVGFDKEGHCISMEISPDFWTSQTFEQQLFVVCHEFKHVLNRHGIRSIHITDKTDRDLANIAMDICVNEDLIDRFGFDRKTIDPENLYIWADKIAKELKLPSLPTDKTFEYYYELLKNCEPEAKQKMVGGNPTLDDHSNFGANKEEEKNLREFLSKIAGEMSPGEMREIREALNSDKDTNYGLGSGGSIFQVNHTKVAPKKKWETVIKKWAKRAMAMTPFETQSWVLPNRRLTAIHSNLSLPSDMDVESNRSTIKKIKVWFFLDTSGSCWYLKERFFTAASSLPKERFDISLYCFDTEVFETTLKSRKVYGGGGTRLDIIEDYIRLHTANQPHPDAVFIITDADGKPVQPSKPERWFWFLVEGSRLDLVPVKCNKYMLKDYE